MLRTSQTWYQVPNAMLPLTPSTFQPVSLACFGDVPRSIQPQGLCISWHALSFLEIAPLPPPQSFRSHVERHFPLGNLAEHPIYIRAVLGGGPGSKNDPHTVSALK